MRVSHLLTTSLIIPGTDIKTLSLLLDLLTEGTSSQDFVSIESIQELAVSLGIDLQNVGVSGGMLTGQGVEEHQKVR